ncbi:MAG: hypothetical protein BWY86_00608 [Candidatus Aminicenantes bacterium ADurb.Bin508]|nr:MAG: hypothetical protein BWY86_00608 [Candidatus Aminicenantes bacterium ADurb.Bin508]
MCQRGHHGGQTGGEGGGEGGDAAPSGRRGDRGDFVDEPGHPEGGEPLLLLFLIDQILHDPLLGVEGGDRGEVEALDGDLDKDLLGDSGRPFLFAQVETARVEKGVPGDQAYDFASRDQQPQLVRLFPDRFEDFPEGSLLVVEKVDGDLGDSVLVDIPSDGANVREDSRLPKRGAVAVPEGVPLLVLLDSTVLSDGEGDLVGELFILCVQVHVVGDQELPGSDHGGAGTGHVLVVGPGSEVRRKGAQLLGEGFVLPFPQVGKTPSLFAGCCRLVEVDWDRKFLPYPFSQALGQLGALLHGDVLNGDEGNHVRGSHPRVGAVLQAHVDRFGRFLDGLKGGFRDVLGLADEGEDGSVGGEAGVDIEQGNPRDGENRPLYLLKNLRVSAFGKVRDTLDNFFHGSPR